MSLYDKERVNDLSLSRSLPRPADARQRTGEVSARLPPSRAVAVLHDLVCIGRYLDTQCETEEEWGEFVRLGGFHFVLGRMHSFPQDQSIQALCCALLVTFLRLESDDASPPTSPEQPFCKVTELRVGRAIRVPSEWLYDVERGLVECGLGRALLQAIEKHPAHGQIQILGSVLLQRFTPCLLFQGNMEESEVGSALKVANTLIHRVVAGGLPGHVTTTEWRSRIAQAIELLQTLDTYGYDLDEVLVESGLMVDLAEHCSGSFQAQFRYLELLFTILEEIPSTCGHLLSLAPLVIRVMKSRIQDKVLAATGCGILLMMAHESERGKSTVVLHGGLHCVVRVLLCNTPSLACAILSTGVLLSLAASSNPDVRRQLHRTSPILWDALLAAHRLHGSCSDLTARIASVFDLAWSTPPEGAEET
jgi:hypothetical protein